MLRTTFTTERAGAASPMHMGYTPIYSALVLALVVIGLFFFRESLLACPLERLSNIASFLMLVVLVLVVRAARLGLWSASFMYMVVFSLFHFGATIVYGLNLPIGFDLQLAINGWFFLPQNREAIVLATIGLVSCGLGICVALMVRAPAAREREPVPSFGNLLGIAGFVLTALCVAGWFATVIGSGGVSLLFGSYSSLLDSTQASSIYIYYGFGLGLTFLAAAPATKLRTIGFVLFGFWCLFALPLGLRGEVLFPTVAAFVVAARRRIPLSKKQLLAGGLVLLVLIALVREVRQVGLEGYDVSEIHLAPQDALAELGSSLRPVTVVVLWHAAGDQLLYGASYWAPIERVLSRLIPDLNTQRVSGLDDERLLNVLVQDRVGPIGFSPIAEAYYNFGSIGVLIVMLLTGALLGYLDRLPTTRLSQAVVGVVFVPLLIQIRNAFTQVPFQILIGLLVIGALVLIGRMLRKEGS